jgi:hypothetical protein
MIKFLHHIAIINEHQYHDLIILLKIIIPNHGGESHIRVLRIKLNVHYIWVFRTSLRQVNLLCVF